MQGSNYPPGVTGAEPYLAGTSDGPNLGDVQDEISRAMAELELLGDEKTDAHIAMAHGDHAAEALASLENAKRLVDELEDLDAQEPDVEEIDETTSLEAEIAGEFDDLRILEIPLELEHRKNLLGLDYDVPRYAVLGVPKDRFTEGDRLDVQRILYAVRIHKAEPEASA
jgi:hypothetical protein